MFYAQKTLTKALFVGVAGALVACASVLPTTTSKNKSQFASYQEAKTAFDRVVLDKTTDADLKAHGFDTHKTPNVRVLNYVDVVNLFGNAFTVSQLPEGVKKCVDAREDCAGYVLNVQDIKNKREGNVAADLFGFKKHTHTTGWQFQATLIMVKDVVVYKLWTGTPEIESFEKQSNPLGPMQNLGGVLPKPSF